VTKPSDKLSVLKIKAASYCAYQERSIQQVSDKLTKLNASPIQLEEVIVWLRKENFLDETRFAEAYVSGKFKLKKWGRIKIIHGLKMHRVDEDIINQALETIDLSDYHQTLQLLYSKKESEIGKLDSSSIRKKLSRYLIGKGFEWDQVQAIINQNK